MSPSPCSPCKPLPAPASLVTGPTGRNESTPIFQETEMSEAKKTAPKVKKVVLAYSGGLDTSVILKWLQDTYNCEVVTFTADIGQGGELAPARAKARRLG